MDTDSSIETEFLDALIDLCLGVRGDRKQPAAKAQVASAWQRRFEERKIEIEAAQSGRGRRKVVAA